MGNEWLNWGALGLGILVFLFGFVFLSHFGKAYRDSKRARGMTDSYLAYRTGRSTPGTGAVGCSIVAWSIAVAVGVGAALYYCTSLSRIGLPLLIGVSLVVSGILLFLLSLIGGVGIADRDARAARDRILHSWKDGDE